MPIPAFPSYLPKVLMTEYGFEPKTNVLRTEIKEGLSVKRRRTTKAPTEVTVTWLFTSDEMALFQRFFDVEAKVGASWFTIPLVNGTGEFTVTARFKEGYSAMTEAKEHAWRVAATLEVLEMQLL